MYATSYVQNQCFSLVCQNALRCIQSVWIASCVFYCSDGQKRDSNLKITAYHTSNSHTQTCWLFRIIKQPQIGTNTVWLPLDVFIVPFTCFIWASSSLNIPVQKQNSSPLVAGMNLAAFISSSVGGPSLPHAGCCGIRTQACPTHRAALLESCPSNAELLISSISSVMAKLVVMGGFQVWGIEALPGEKAEAGLVCVWKGRTLGVLCLKEVTWLWEGGCSWWALGWPGGGLWWHRLVLLRGGLASPRW